MFVKFWSAMAYIVAYSTFLFYFSSGGQERVRIRREYVYNFGHLEHRNRLSHFGRAPSISPYIHTTMELACQYRKINVV